MHLRRVSLATLLRTGLPRMALAGVALAGCLTGERPTLLVDDTIPQLSDRPAMEVIDALDSGLVAPFTITYKVTTRFGGLVTAASVSHDQARGTSVTIAEVRYLTRPDGSTLTCSTVTGACVPGLDETRVSDRQLTSSIFTASAAERIRQDLRVAVADSTPSSLDLAGRTATCVVVPVVDSNGILHEKHYCVFADLHVIAMLNTADLLIEPMTVLDEADAALFATG